VPQPPGPAVLKKRLGDELRALRTATTVTVAQAAVELGCSEGKVRHMELGRNLPSKPDLTVLMALYGVNAEIHAALEELRQAAGKRGWWSTYRLPTWLQNYVGMEADASVISNFELELIPGLLQTEAYARATHVATPHLLPAGEIDRMVTARLKRQERLTAAEPAQLHAIISEAALHRVRGTNYATEQYRHLVAMSERPNITINVLPFSKGLHQSMSGGFVLLDFPPGVSASVAYFEYAIAGQMEDDQEIVTKLRDVFAHLNEQSLGDEESSHFIGEWI
jgi:transcriptional regulator with XRE-family HTH domain